ncbi:hypothetical protein LIER_12178 [Lithospermum erythrorhizon]|uniref:MULE transposase domain-containing protein n=1 Tax=Lithospermum erythrorhizon TaxID=34254 RepID=A0AAV3PT56_LITER
MVCSKAGEKFIKKGPCVERRYKRAIIRTGCRAKMRLKMDWIKKGYVIYEWADNYNHDFVDLDKIHLMRTYREIKPEHKAMIDVHVKNEISVRSKYDALLHTYGTIEDMGFTRTDFWNFVSSVKRMEMFPRDVVTHKWLRDQSISKPGFFFDIELDDERGIQFVFWADAVMISDYAKFGDFVSFDTTYMNNDTAKPLGIFVGFNHHKCTTIFGTALMYDETGKSFKWLFETFLKCMNHRFPKTLMTYQAPTIALSISDYASFGVNMVVDFRFNEKSRDYYMQQTIPANNFKNSSLMSHAASVFTPQIFNEIQHEFEAGMTYTIKETLDVEQYFCSSLHVWCIPKEFLMDRWSRSIAKPCSKIDNYSGSEPYGDEEYECMKFKKRRTNDQEGSNIILMSNL